MCGIVAYMGSRQAYPVIIKGLHRLEYRGYDSAGVGLQINQKLAVYKCKGKVSDLEAFVGEKPTDSTIGIGHTRWATHGVPNDVNAHPHFSQTKRLIMIHNGIIENYAPLKQELQRRGHSFESDTDTEVLVHLIEEIMTKEQIDLPEAVRQALNEVVGAYAIVVMEDGNNDLLVAAKKGSPLVVGVGKDEYFCASDATPIIEYTKNVVYLDEEEIAVIRRGQDLRLINIANQAKTPYIQELEMSLEAIEKGGYPHFMLKEIFEQPRSIKDSMRGRMNADEHYVKMGGISEYSQKIMYADRFIIVACGTSWHAGLVAEYLFEDLTTV
jgi:glucosamine--fructose-6-phosphate aminotransferase (isomerizing)